jgi:hypothetical protein
VTHVVELAIGVEITFDADEVQDFGVLDGALYFDLDGGTTHRFARGEWVRHYGVEADVAVATQRSS